MSEDKNRIVIQSKGIGPKWETKFFKDIESAIKSGYSIPSDPSRIDRPMRNFKGKWGRVVLYKDGQIPVEDSTSKSEEKEEVVITVVEDPVEKEEEVVLDNTEKQEVEEKKEQPKRRGRPSNKDKSE